MKKYLYLFLLISISLILSSCEKADCNCGVITDDAILGNDCYSLTVRNDCSDNIETFCFTEDVWYDNYVGGDFCVTNVDSW